MGGIIVTAKIIKLLNLSTSENDNEALSAIRAANQIVRNNGLTWEDLIESGVASRKPTYSEPAPGNEERETVEEIIDFIRVNAWPGFDFGFVDSIAENYRRWGKLTSRQMAGLLKVFRAVQNNATKSV